MNKSLYQNSALASWLIHDRTMKGMENKKNPSIQPKSIKKSMNINIIIFLPSPSLLCPASMESLQNGKDRISYLNTSFTEASVSPNSKINFCHPKGIGKNPTKQGWERRKCSLFLKSSFPKAPSLLKQD